MATVYDCIVLGAGISGVTAARDLQKKGLKVLLLEGSDRIGGRMYSMRDFVTKDGQPIPLEAGAEYIHVSDSYAEFWAEVRKQGFTASALHKYGLGFLRIPRNRLFFPGWATTLMLAEILSVPELWEVPKCLRDLQEFDPRRQDDVSAKEFAEQCVRKHTLGPRARDLLLYTLTAHTPGMLDDLSIAGIAADNIPSQLMEPIEYRMEIDRGKPQAVCGYDRLPDRIAREFRGDGGTLTKSQSGRTDRRVVQVERLANGTLAVTTKNGKRYEGRSAVCTFSVGMLNPETGEGDSIFGPLLTAEKRTALDTVRMGAITKFALEFKERAWIDDGGHASGHMSVLSNPRGKARTFFSSFPKEHTGPHVLTGLLMNQDHRSIANLSDERAVAHVFEAIGKIYGRKRSWKQEDVLAGAKDDQGSFRANFRRQDWSKDEFAKGGNSYIKYFPKNQRKMPPRKAREALKNPRETLPLFWAGEATAPAYEPRYQPLAVHGAYMSGVRVAEDVFHYLNDARVNAARFATYYKNRYPNAS